MRNRAHQEQHFTGGALVRDLVIGMSDGLTVPFALAAGLSGAVAASRLVVTAGMAEVVAGSIAMGLGGFMAARSDAEHYEAELAREHREIVDKTADEEREVEEIFAVYGVSAAEAAPVLQALQRDPEKWVAFMMKFELGLERPNSRQALRSAITIALAYVTGGLVPLAPYFFTETTSAALLPSVGLTAVALFVFGAVKGRFTTGRPWAGALQTLLIGGLAAGAAFGFARLLG